MNKLSTLDSRAEWINEIFYFFITTVMSINSTAKSRSNYNHKFNCLHKKKLMGENSLTVSPTAPGGPTGPGNPCCP